MTASKLTAVQGSFAHSRVSGNPEPCLTSWVPAFAGTSGWRLMHRGRGGADDPCLPPAAEGRAGEVVFHPAPRPAGRGNRRRRWAGRGSRLFFRSDSEASSQTPPILRAPRELWMVPLPLSRWRMQYDPGLARALRARTMSNSAFYLPPPFAMTGSASHPTGAGRFELLRSNSLRLASGNKRKEAERRQTRSPRPVRKRRTGRAADKAACAALPLRARSPAGVPPRHLRQRPNATAQLQFTRFPGRSY
jgi:hypothetical protein